MLRLAHFLGVELARQNMLVNRGHDQSRARLSAASRSDAYGGFMTRHELQVAAFEFIVDGNGHAYTYDINTNTNYNASAEYQAGRTSRSGMLRLAHFLGVELARQNMLVNRGHDQSRARLSAASR